MSKSNNKSPATKTVEQKYKKMSQHEHVLKRPDTYIGSIKEENIKLWIYNDESKDGEPNIVLKEIKYVPGLFKIFDEILVNARDHATRCESCNTIKVNIDQEKGEISVWNNGDGIEVEEHKEHKILIPTMIFSELLTGSNYDDDEKRTVGGTNGLGAKLTNIWSTQFEVETVDDNQEKKFYQVFSNNMYEKGKPKVTSAKGKKPYTKITFIPDYKRFGLEKLDDDTLALFKKRVYDIAITPGIKVYYNDDLIKSNSFLKYIDLYFPDGSDHKKVHDVSDDNWRICVIYDPTDAIEHQNISFVNGISTTRGGTHVDYIVNQVTTKLKDSVSKKLKNFVVKPSMIKENLIFFVDSVIENPRFDTQTKECLKTKVTEFGSSYTVSEAFIKKVIKTGVVDQIIANARAKAEANLSKTDASRARFDHPKLYDAGEAGKKNGYKCSLILTEGDSAKGFALAGLNVIGRKYYGVFPLKGKLMNVRDKSATDIAGNEEITAIKKIIGLEQGKVYEDTKGLRYGKIIILTDQDVDGFHIKGLIINFFHFFWPSLLKINGFIECLATPVVKVSKGNKTIEFTSLPEYEKWKAENNDGKGWTIKYFKGLGTSDAKGAQKCFEDLEEKKIKYIWEDCEEEDQKKVYEEISEEEPEEEPEEETYVPKLKDINKDAITLAFDRKRGDDRKVWLNTYDPDNYIDNTQKEIPIKDFIHREMINFSIDDVKRSIPSIMDGFKPSQRKVYYAAVKKNIYDNEIKVAQLGGFVSEKTEYHHGEQSLFETIVGMAQNFVGSNNINILTPNGNFGTRACGGKDAASPRYIFTQLDTLGKKVFIKEDYDVLKKQYENCMEIEPEFYVPIIPMVLVNGTEGIGTGYSTLVKPCNPREIYHNLKRIIKGEKITPMKPWYRHFTGEIVKLSKNKYISKAKYEIINDDTLHITDLPIGTWTENYKQFIIKVVEGKPSKVATTEKKETKSSKGKTSKANTKKSKTAKISKKSQITSYVKSYTEDCTDIRVSFTIHFYPGKLQELIKKGKLEKELKLTTPLNNTNMHLFDHNGKIKKYDSYGDIMKSFAEVRLKLYQDRKDYLLGKWRKEMDLLKWKMKFIQNVIDGKIIIFKNGSSKKKAEVIEKLEELKFPKFAVGDDKLATYNYITSIPLFHLTEEEVEKLKKMLQEKKEDIETLENKSPSDIWEEELDDFIKEYDRWEAEVDLEYDNLMKKKKTDSTKKKTRKSSKKLEAEA